MKSDKITKLCAKIKYLKTQPLARGCRPLSTRREIIIRDNREHSRFPSRLIERRIVAE